MAYNKERANDAPELIEKVVYLNRVSKTVKGGRVMKFSALVVVGDGKGTVGYGLGKAAEVSEAILKGIADAKKNMVKVTLSWDDHSPRSDRHLWRWLRSDEACCCRYWRYRRRRCPCCHGSGWHQQHPYQVPALQQPAERCQGDDAGSDVSARPARNCTDSRQERRRDRRLRRALT